MTVRPRRLASATSAAGLAIAALAGLTGCGAKTTIEPPTRYTALPTEAPTLGVTTKPGTRYAVAGFPQGE